MNSEHSRHTRYRLLADDLARAIRSGTLAAGSALPSLRQSAAERRLSLNTVTAAYRLLERQGLVAVRPQSGFYVRSTLPAPQLPLRGTPTRVAGGVDEDMVAVVLAAQQDPKNLDLALACPSGAAFYPGDSLARLTRSVLRRHRDRIATYALPPGSERLRAQIARRGRRLGLSLDPEDIVLTHGCTEALQLALRAVTRPGDWVGVEAPAYFNLYPLLSSLGLTALEIPTHPQSGLAISAVEQVLKVRRVAALVAMPTVHNPLGCTMPRDAKVRLADLMRRHGVPLIEDAVYADLQYSEASEPTVKTFDRDGWVILCSGYSKTLAPDYRIGWMEAGRFGSRVRQLKFASSGGEPVLLGEAVGRFLEEGGYDRHLASVRRLYESNVSAVRGLIARHFPAGTTATQPAGGFLLWVELPGGADSADLFRAALKRRITVIPGQVYSVGSRYRSCLRLSCCRKIDDGYVAAIKTLGRLAGSPGANF